MLEQRLSNYLYKKDYKKAINLGLHMDKPKLVLKVLNALLSKEETNKDDSSLNNVQNILQTHIKTLSMDRIIQLLKYVRDWNTYARNATIAMIVLRCIIMSVEQPSSFFDKSIIQNKEIIDILSGIIPYMERHIERLDKIYMDSFVLDYLVYVMTDGMIGGDTDDDDNVEEDDNAYENWVKNRKIVVAPTDATKNDDDGMDIDNDTIVTIGESSSSSSSSGGDDDDELSIDSLGSKSGDN